MENDKQKLFDIKLPKTIRLAQMKLDFFVEGEGARPLQVEILDYGAGAFVRLTAPDSVDFDVEELRELTETLASACSFIDEEREKI